MVVAAEAEAEAEEEEEEEEEVEPISSALRVTLDGPDAAAASFGVGSECLAEDAVERPR